jgi:hypothetical protein
VSVIAAVGGHAPRLTSHVGEKGKAVGAGAARKNAISASGKPDSGVPRA